MVSQVMERVGGMIQSLAGGAVVIEGDAGMGKSRLLQEVQENVLRQFMHRICVVFGCSDMSHKSQVRHQICPVCATPFRYMPCRCSLSQHVPRNVQFAASQILLHESCMVRPAAQHFCRIIPQAVSVQHD